MYLSEGRVLGEVRPCLAVRLDEPMLLRTWFLNLSIGKMNRLWKLNVELSSDWYGHFQDRILSPNYNDGTVSISGNRSGGAVNPASVVTNKSKWDQWMDSTEDASLFGSVPLKKFVNENGNPLPALMLAPDTYCIECDEVEPTWLFQGTERSYLDVNANYKSMINSVLSRGMFGYHLEIANCPKCSPGTVYATPSYMSYSRRRPGTCECMPCRRSL